MTWVVPSDRVMVPSVPDSPDTAVGMVPEGTVIGGQSWAHEPVQVEDPAVSVVRW